MDKPYNLKREEQIERERTKRISFYEDVAEARTDLPYRERHKNFLESMRWANMEADRQMRELYLGKKCFYCNAPANEPCQQGCALEKARNHE